MDSSSMASSYEMLDHESESPRKRRNAPQERIASLESERDKAQAYIEILQTKIESLKSVIENQKLLIQTQKELSVVIDSLKGEIREKAAEIVALKTKIAEKDAQMAEVQANNTAAESAKTYFEEELKAKFQADLPNQQRRNAQIEALIAGMRERMGKLNKAINSWQTVDQSMGATYLSAVVTLDWTRQELNLLNRWLPLLQQIRNT